MLWRTLIKKHKWNIILFLCLGFLTAFLTGYSADYFQVIIDHLDDGILTLQEIIFYGALLLFLFVFNYIDEYPSRKLEHGIYLDLKTKALEKISRIDYLAYQKIGTGALVQQIETGAAAGRDMFFSFWLQIFGQILPTMLVSFFFVYTINRTVMLTLLIGYVVVFLVSTVLLKMLYRVKENTLVNAEKFNHVLVRGFMEMVVFRVNKRFANEIQKARNAAEEITSANTKMALVHEAFFAIFAILMGLVKVAIIIYAWQSHALSVGEVVALIALVENAYTPIAIFNVIYVQYRLNEVAWKKYKAFLAAPEDPRLTRGNAFAAKNGAISLKGVSFSYGEKQILQNFSMEILAGMQVALVGESGAGKSTIIRLLGGLLTAQAGNVFVDGQVLENVLLSDYYDYVQYIPQESPIFDGTLRENLAFDEEIEETTLLGALQEMALGPWYARLEEGLDTRLGERGITLSGGERQRLALARLYLQDPQIILLDEATSALDNVTEEAVMTCLLQRFWGKTMVVVAHRLRSVQHLEQIFVLRDGAVVEAGDFISLIQKHGYFYTLYEADQRKEARND